MNTIGPNAQAAVAAVAAATGVDIAASTTTLTVDGASVPLPTKAGSFELKGSYGDLMGIKGLLPTVPQGDDRDRLLWWIVGEARDDGAEQTQLARDTNLYTELPQRLGFTDDDANQVVAAAIKDRFFSSKKLHNLKPVHSSLPMNYAYGTNTNKPARWRMFSAEIIVFLLYDETTAQTDRDLLAELLEFFESDDDLTAIDKLFLQAAVADTSFPESRPVSGALVDKYESSTRADLTAAGGVFCRPSLELFRRDLATVLATNLPKPDKIQWLTLLLSLHISSRMYRLALIKGNELDAALAVAADTTAPDKVAPCACGPATAADGFDCLNACPLAGAMKFRTGAGRYRPISRRDEARNSYINLDQRKLLALPAVLVTTNLALRAWTALGGPNHESATARDLAEAVAADQHLRNKVNAVCAAIAVLHHARHRTNAPIPVLTEAAGLNENGHLTPGLVALRNSVLRLRRTDLRHQSRDVVNQLLLDLNAAAGGSLVSRNGTHTFYEADERMILMLVRLVCADGPQSYEDFLRGIAAYGLAPQDADESAALADALERLGLLVRYSDAGEASFVHYAN